MIVNRKMDLDTPADAVWEVVGRQFADVSSWASAVAQSEASPDGDGRVCTVVVPGMDRIVERLIDFDDAARRFTYVAEGMPWAVAHAENRWSVEALGQGRSRVSMGIDISLVPSMRWASPLARLALAALSRRTLRDLRVHLAAHATTRDLS
jgi:hypothetical protein